MPRSGGNRGRQQRASKRFPKPQPPAAPRPAGSATPPRPSRPSNSAQERALRLQAALGTGVGQVTERWAEIFAPTSEQRAERDRQMRADAVQDHQEKATKPEGVEMDPMSWWALEMARQGMDVYLLPYQPTPSTNPPRPRTLAAGYDKSTQTLRIRFRNGSVYGYYHVPPNIWRNLRRNANAGKGVGRFINRVLNFYPYAPEPDLDMPTGMV
ncbi:KTSC domain-containing protein [Microbispora sp. NPDC049633]|uniref:KTSC domain-containing protein n=1 Tax=Microbispora sp. NPDC049633 TaxID=3154355 RepID=UPI003439BCC9